MGRRVFVRIAGALKPGVSELLVHPDITNDDRPYDNGYDWIGDLTAMTTCTKEECQRHFGLQLVTYRDAWTTGQGAG
jgi:hypothetical protein